MTVLGDLAAILICGNELYPSAIGRMQPVARPPLLANRPSTVHGQWTARIGNHLCDEVAHLNR